MSIFSLLHSSHSSVILRCTSWSFIMLFPISVNDVTVKINEAALILKRFYTTQWCRCRGDVDYHKA